MTSSTVPVVSGRAPCPCGSGRRYKACHGRSQTTVAPNPRPFAGRVDEADLVALRELVPSATAPLRLLADPSREAKLVTALPLGSPAMVRDSGEILIALQAAARSDDPARDLGQAIEAALAAEPATTLDALGAPGPGPGFGDLVAPDRLEITVHPGFDWLLAGREGVGEAETEALEQANARIVPTERLTSVEAAYWCRIGDKCHLRWAMSTGEDALLDAFARIHEAKGFDLGADTRFVGAFRACGLLIPVWDLPADRDADELEAPAAALGARIVEALAAAAPLTASQRASRAGIVSRQLTIR